MRLLVYSTYFWPERVGPAPYVTEPVRYLAARGVTVDVWSGFPHYPSWSRRDRRLAATDTLDGIRIHRLAHMVPSSQTAGGRAAYEGTLLAGALTSIVTARKPDAILGVTPTLSGAVAAAVASRRFRVPFGLLVHDLMGSAAKQSGVAGGERVAALIRRIEHGVARRAAAIGVIAEGFRAYFTDAGVSDDRIFRLRTWNLGAGASASREESRRVLGWREGETVVLHAGNMGQKQGLDNVLAAASLLPRGFRVVLAGDGNDRRRLEDEAERRGLANVEFLGGLPWGEYEAALVAADVLAVNQRAAVGDMSLPSKLTSYFASGRPTVAAVAAGSETAREIGSAGAGVVVAPEDPEALASAICEVAGDEQRARELGANALDFAARVLAPEVVLPEYERFVRAICT